jgi:Tfp pilus assembly protein PilN
MWAFCLVGILCCGAFSQQRQRIVQLEKEQQTILRRVNPLRLQQIESKAVREKLAELRMKHALYSMLEDELPVVQILGVVSQSASDPERRILVTDLRADEVLRAVPGSATPPGPRNARAANPAQEKVLTVVIGGVAHDDQIVTRFVSRLQDAKMFHSVKLKSTSGGNQPMANGRHFEVECVY